MPVPLTYSSIFCSYHETNGRTAIIFRNCEKSRPLFWMTGTPRTALTGYKSAIQNK